jgi:ectoine hydroxylase-related dioxygenase (phytanoyl-CoA dioxygenase family)
MTMTATPPVPAVNGTNGTGHTETFPYRQRTFAQDDVDGMVQALHDDGFALIPGVLNQTEVDEVKEAIDRLKPFGFDKLGINDHFKCVFNRETVFLDLIDREPVIQLAEGTMGGQCHIIGETAWRSHPGHNGWSPHTDRVFVTMPEDMASDPRFKLPIYLCTAHYYLTDLTLDLAPTYVIPGSHKSGRALSWGKEQEPEWNGRKLEPVLCKAGDVLFFRSEIWHTGSKNTSEQTRYLLQVHYSHRFIAQQFSPYLNFQFAPHILAQATPRQRRLLGEHSQGAYD